MLISETGNSVLNTARMRSAEHGFAFRGRSAEHGFTLAELMIVMVITALMAAVVILAMPDPRGRLIDTAERFAARTRIMRDQAVVSGQATRLSLDPLGYGFAQRRAGIWQTPDQPGLARVDWGDGVTISMNSEVRKTIDFDTTGLASESTQLLLSRNGDQVRITIDQGGDIRIGL